MAKAYFSKLMAFVAAARSKSTVFPPEGQTFTALYLTPLDSIKVVILGQVSHMSLGCFCHLRAHCCGHRSDVLRARSCS